MTSNTIMVQLDIDSAPAPRLNLARALADRFEADLIGFAAAEPYFVVSAEGGMIASELIRRSVDDIEQRLKFLEQEFDALTKGAAGASWRGFVGDPTRLLALHSRAADLIVTGAPAPGIANDYQRTIDAGSLILSAGRPILLTSEKPEPVRFDSIVVAWKDAREARRAMVDALPFLTRAKDVLVVTVEEAEPKEARESVAEVVHFLAKHGVRARSEVIDVDVSQAVDAMTTVAADLGANLIVSGGYGHSRLRQWAFGGVTRSLLQETGLHRLISN